MINYKNNVNGSIGVNGQIVLLIAITTEYNFAQEKRLENTENAMNLLLKPRIVQKNVNVSLQIGMDGRNARILVDLASAYEPENWSQIILLVMTH